MEGTVDARARLNIRLGSPSSAAALARTVNAGDSLAVTGLTKGEAVFGNDEWYTGPDNTFYWSGACTPFVARTASGAGTVHRRSNGTIRALSEAEIINVFGPLPFQEGSGGRIIVDPEWTRDTIVAIATPQFADLGYPTLQVHAKAEAAFTSVLLKIAGAGLNADILTIGGTYVTRHKGWDAKRGLSSHSWGIAIDLNVEWNAYGCVPAALGAHGSLRRLVSLFESEGFAWGGYFEPIGLCDGMHFELARLDL
jgi:hypothetical protein